MYMHVRHSPFWKSEKWRLTVRAKLCSAKDRERVTEAAKLAEKTSVYVEEHGASFALFGVTINKALVASIATTVFGSLWAWISPYL